ncbi:hypothetical protein GUJ93_ZPchr0003g17437 [Zizania palustris]|uniref:Uncharacterized protein n=1 Tax=Zizania palustris TaxID=103762 RepID=A0A8J5SCS6_ZIZPA|nr:hypothetical protein GUJ93_ZPchr0003g17437 [Zizania palustris]
MRGGGGRLGGRSGGAGLGGTPRRCGGAGLGGRGGSRQRGLDGSRRRSARWGGPADRERLLHARLRLLAHACVVEAAKVSAGGASVERLRKRLGTDHPPLAYACGATASSKRSEPLSSPLLPCKPSRGRTEACIVGYSSPLLSLLHLCVGFCVTSVRCDEEGISKVLLLDSRAAAATDANEDDFVVPVPCPETATSSFDPDENIIPHDYKLILEDVEIGDELILEDVEIGDPTNEEEIVVPEGNLCR